MSTRTSLTVVMLLVAASAGATEWVEIGADTEATYYVDVSSIEVEADTLRVLKKGVYPHPLKEDLGGASEVFTETLGVIELDCGRRINRVVQIDMIGLKGEVVWSSGRMSQRPWEDVRPNTHGEATLDFVCGKLGKS
jgi:Surface-adhesin protein E